MLVAMADSVIDLAFAEFMSEHEPPPRLLQLATAVPLHVPARIGNARSSDIS
jgi:hypothetical protein